MGKLLFTNLSLMLVLLLTSQGNAMGPRPGPASLTGTIRLVGNEPFVKVVLTTDIGENNSERVDYLLVGDLEHELRNSYQGAKLTLEGIPCPPADPRFSGCFEPTKIIRVYRIP